MNAITMVAGLLLAGARVRVYSIGGELDLGYGRYRGQVARDDADENLRLEPAQVSESKLTEPQLQALATAPEQLMCTRFTTARIELDDSDRVVYGHLCWWRVAENDQLPGQ